MNFKKEYQQLILPLFRSAPVIIGLIVITVLVMKRAVTYMTPEYRAHGAIKINNLSYSEAAIGMFGKEEAPLPKQSESFLTEVEVFQSKDLIRKTLENLDWELTIYRIGKMRHVELYEESPVTIEYNALAPEAYDKLFHFDYLGENRFRFRQGGEEDTTGVIVAMGDTLKLPTITFSIQTLTEFVEMKPQSLQPGDLFAFRVNSMDALLNVFSGQQLYVKPVEKDVSIIKLYFNHELPEKAQMFVNELMRTYIEQGRESKRSQANETLEYLDEQLALVSGKLQAAEGELAFFRSSNKLLNPMQETDATLKEFTNLDLQKVDLQMKMSELERLKVYLYSGNGLEDFSPNFEALQDPIFRENYLRAQSYETSRKDLLQKYTAQNPHVTNLDEKTRETRAFLNESVNATMTNLYSKQLEIEENLKEVDARIKRYPAKERQLVVLERQVSQNESIYNYLTRKRTEVAIGSTSDFNPHKIIEHAERPKTIASPNKSLLFGLAVLLSLMAGMVYAYLRSFFKDKVAARDELAAIDAPVMGVVFKKAKKDPAGFSLVSGLVANLEKLPPSETKGQGRLFVVSSLVPGEGKSFTASQLASAFAAAGHRVLLVDMDVRKPCLHDSFAMENQLGYADILENRVYALDAIRKTRVPKLHLLTAGHLASQNFALLFSRRSLGFVHDFRWHFDMVIVDTPPLGVFEDSLPLMGESTANLFIIRAGYSKRRMLANIDRLLKEAQVPNVHLVMNDVKISAKVPGFGHYVKKYYSKKEMAEV